MSTDRVVAAHSHTCTHTRPVGGGGIGGGRARVCVSVRAPVTAGAPTLARLSVPEGSRWARDIQNVHNDA